MPGPPPKDPNARRRRNPTPGFRLLPHEGRTGPIPDFPLPSPDQGELSYWREIWSLPQAVEWERMRCERFVALYVRSFIAASMGGADPKLLAEVRQLDAKIGISPKAMRDMRWETDEPEQDPEPDAQPSPEPPARAYVPKKP